MGDSGKDKLLSRSGGRAGPLGASNYRRSGGPKSPGKPRQNGGTDRARLFSRLRMFIFPAYNEEEKMNMAAIYVHESLEDTH
jgi:hypothetical protein